MRSSGPEAAESDRSRFRRIDIVYQNLTAFALACVFILICGYNRIHMTNHFLSDVCFGTLNTTLLTAVICQAFMLAGNRMKE